MICPKCKSRMFVERIFTESGSYDSWHCLICGNYYDQEAAENRRESMDRIGKIGRGSLKVPVWEVS